MFSILGSHSVGRKHKLVTAGSESTLFFSMNKLVPSLKSRLLKTHTHIELKKKKLRGNCSLVENFSLSF